jgi:hypothetical protein
VTNYEHLQFISYGAVTSAPTRVLPGGALNAYAADAESRAQTLCDVADWIASHYAASLGGPDTLKVLLVPEFYFRFGGPSDPADNVEDSYPNGEILLPNVVDKVLRPHFAVPGYEDWLIIAGTMFWHKSAQDSGAAHPTYFNTVLALHGGTDTDLTPQEQEDNRDARAVPTMGAVSTNQKALMSRIDYALNIDRREWDSAINPMFQPVLGDWQWWRWHMFSVHGIAGPAGNPLVFGLEVCLEHLRAGAGRAAGQGALRALRAQNPYLPEIDVHLVTSCGMTLDANAGVEARVGGYAAICDGIRPKDSGWPWPRTDVQVVTDIDTSSGRHNTGPAASLLDRQNLPSTLQLGVPGSTHTPPDAVAVWQPVTIQD